MSYQTTNPKKNITPLSAFGYASFLSRMVAHTIDASLVIILLLASNIVYLFLMYYPNSASDYYATDMPRIFNTIAYIVLSALLNCGGILFFNTTPGKALCGIHIIGFDGQKPSIGKIVYRETIGKLLSAALFNFGYIVALLNKKSQSLHDILSHTYVVTSKPYDHKRYPVVNALFAGLLLAINITVSLGIFIFLPKAVFGQTLIVDQLLIKEFAVTPNSHSMAPTLLGGDLIISDILTPKLPLQYTRGDIVVFEPTQPEFKERNIISRIVGLPGETIKIGRDKKVYINNALFNEPYLQSNLKTDGGIFLGTDEPITIPANNYVVLSDNRENALDSRNTFGFIPKEKIIAKYILKIRVP